MSTPNRREVLLGGAAAAALAGPLGAASTTAPRLTEAEPQLRFAVKIGMVQGEATPTPLVDKFKLLKTIGYDGIELDSPNGLDRDEVLRARDASGLPIHGVVDSIHWNKRLSSPDESVRGEALRGLETAIRDAHAYGGSSVLLVPGRVADAEKENHDHVWERSIEGIRKVLPLAAELGIHILIENVWNHFLYVHDGPADQTADQLAAYLDEIASPWVGAYFDIGNHRKYGAPEEWIRTLGRRIVKLDVKDWGKQSSWANIGDGDVDWAAVRKALGEIGYHGWATAEVGGGGEERLREIKRRMDAALRG
ncbi:MAG: sugar phosphate isomerase/epimerase [bacterium]|nr:sugar phosphate isomerase/epimerase [bacterium]